MWEGLAADIADTAPACLFAYWEEGGRPYIYKEIASSAISLLL